MSRCFLRKKTSLHIICFHPGVEMGSGDKNAAGRGWGGGGGGGMANFRWTSTLVSHPGVSSNIPSRFMLRTGV